jgi:hypothetical protein
MTKQNFIKTIGLELLRIFIIIMPFKEHLGHKKSLLRSRLYYFVYQ